MRVGLTHLEPVLAKKIAALLCGPRDTFLSKDIVWTKSARRSIFDDDFDEDEVVVRRNKPNSEEKYALVLRRRRDDAVARRRIIVGVPTGIVTLGLFGIAYRLNPNHALISYVAAGLGAVGVLFGTWFGLKWSNMASQRRALKYELILEELISVRTYLDMSAAESAYFDILLLLTNLEANLEARRILRKMMAPVNSILVSSRAIEAELSQSRPAAPEPVSGKKRGKGRFFAFDSDDDDEEDGDYGNEDADHVVSLSTNPTASDEELYGDLSSVVTDLPAQVTEKPVRESVRILEQQMETIVKALQMTGVALSRITVAPGALADKSSKQVIDIAASVKKKTAEAIEAAHRAARDMS